MKFGLLQFTVFLVVLVNILSTSFILYRTDLALVGVTARAANEGTVNFCLNAPPSLSVPCNTTLSQDMPYSCQLNASDPEGASLSFFQIPQPPDNESLFQLASNGSFAFTPTNNDTGNHSVIFGVDDSSGCENAYAYESFNYTIANINDPPYLIKAIPHQTFATNTTLFAFYLSDYFADPDNDPLTFTYLRGASDVLVNITLNPDSSVIFRSSSCGKAHFQFKATDPYNLSASSNAIQVEVTCSESSNAGESEGTGGSGGGGGGGAGLSSCIPELVCLPWSDCYPNGMQVQHCQDKNGCDEKVIKFYQNCTYKGPEEFCEENWLCSDWSVCDVDNQQNRTCVDLNECDTHNFLPPLEQECLYEPRCDDGIQNGNETGVDCGGSCEPCPTIQQPSFLPAATWLSNLWLLAVLLLLTILLALFVLYRERIYEGMAELGWLLSRQKEKELLLAPNEKRALFEDIASLENARLDAPKRYERLSLILRKFLSFIYDLSFEFLPEELEAALAAAKVSPELSEALGGVAHRLALLEAGSLGDFNPLLFSSILEEQRLLICMTSKYDLAEIERELEERPITEELSFHEEVRLRLLNAWEALQFLRVGFAKEEYTRILRAYENLSIEWKTRLYPDIRRLYVEISYVQETSEEGPLTSL